jgi:hypothetical protein
MAPAAELAPPPVARRPGPGTEFKISPDPLLTGKIRDVVGLYLAPPGGAAMTTSGTGTAGLFAALNTATGKVIGKLSAQHRAAGFRDFLDLIDRQVEPGLAIHVICD